MVNFKDFSRPLSVFQVLFKSNLIFKDFSRQSCILKYFSNLWEPWFNIPPTAKETGSHLKVSSDRLEEPEIELGMPGYKASGLSTSPLQCLRAHMKTNWYDMTESLLFV